MSENNSPCSKCGQNIVASAKFCPMCGAQIIMKTFQRFRDASELNMVSNKTIGIPPEKRKFGNKNVSYILRKAQQVKSAVENIQNKFSDKNESTNTDSNEKPTSPPPVPSKQKTPPPVPQKPDTENKNVPPPFPKK